MKTNEIAFTAPSTPESIVFENITTSSFGVSWNMAVSATQYEVVLKNSTSNVATKTSSTLSATFSNLNPGTVYRVTIRARNNGGWSLPTAENTQITGNNIHRKRIK